MGGVADDAAFDFYCRVFEYKRTALLDVALDARLPTGLAERGTIGSAVGIVTVGAFQGTLRDAVVSWQRELRHDISMTPGTQVRLWLFQQTIGQPTSFFWNRGYGKKCLLRCRNRIAGGTRGRIQKMRGVADLAIHAVTGMNGPIKLPFVPACDVTLHAPR